MIPPLSFFFKDCTVQISCCSSGNNKNTRLICKNRQELQKESCWQAFFLGRKELEEQNRNARRFLEDLVTREYGYDVHQICEQCAADDESVGDWRERMQRAHPLTRAEKDRILTIAQDLFKSSPAKSGQSGISQFPMLSPQPDHSKSQESLV